MKRIFLSVMLFFLVAKGMAVLPDRWDNEIIGPEVPAVRGGCFGRFCIPYMRRHNFIAGEIMTKRKSKCSCRTKFELINLTSDCYPQTFIQAKCLSMDAGCNSKFDKCEVLKYKVPYLKRREFSSKEESTSVETSDEEQMLPETLRDEWQLLYKEIGVACLDEETYRALINGPSPQN